MYASTTYINITNILCYSTLNLNINIRYTIPTVPGSYLLCIESSWYSL